MSEKDKDVIEKDSYYEDVDKELKELFERLFVNQLEEKLKKVEKSSEQISSKIEKIEKSQNSLDFKVSEMSNEDNEDSIKTQIIQLDKKTENIIEGLNKLDKADEVIQQTIEVLDNVCDRIEQKTLILGEIADKQTVNDMRESFNEILRSQNKRNVIRFWELLGAVIGSGIIHILLCLFT